MLTEELRERINKLSLVKRQLLEPAVTAAAC